MIFALVSRLDLLLIVAESAMQYITYTLNISSFFALGRQVSMRMVAPNHFSAEDVTVSQNERKQASPYLKQNTCHWGTATE